MRNRLLRKFRELEAMRERVVEGIDGVSEGRLTTPPTPGKWSASQILDHVVTAESRSLEYIGKKTRTPEAVPPAGLMCSVRTFALVVALSSPLRFRTPDAVSDVPDNPDATEALERWGKVRERLRETLETLPEELLGRALFKHPIAGRMNMSQTLDFMTAHLNRHAKQLMRLLA